MLCPYVANRAEGASAQVLCLDDATIREWLVGVKMMRGEVMEAGGLGVIRSKSCGKPAAGAAAARWRPPLVFPD